MVWNDCIALWTNYFLQEYCYPSTRREEARAFLATLLNKLRPRAILPRPRRRVTRRLTADRCPRRPEILAPSRDSIYWTLPGVVPCAPCGPLSRRDRSRRPLAPSRRDMPRRSNTITGRGSGAYEAVTVARNCSPVYEVPRDQLLRRERVSPSSSSGFSSGSDYQETSDSLKKSACKQNGDGEGQLERVKTGLEPVETGLAAAASRESVLADLEWDDAGIELSEDVMAHAAGQFWQSEGLENSILR